MSSYQNELCIHLGEGEQICKGNIYFTRENMAHQLLFGSVFYKICCSSLGAVVFYTSKEWQKSSSDIKLVS